MDKTKSTIGQDAVNGNFSGINYLHAVLKAESISDSDDIVDEKMIEHLYCEESDFSLGGFMIENFPHKEQVLEKAYRGSITNEVLEKILSSLIFQSSWAKMYRKSLIL